jgi:anti-sigma factor RsiW
MSCGRYEQSLFLHAHGQLEGPSRRQLERHLRDCEACRRQWREWAGEAGDWRQALAVSDGRDPGEAALRQAIASRVRALPRTPPAATLAQPWLQPRARFALVAAALLALLLIALAAYRGATRRSDRFRAGLRPGAGRTVVPPSNTPANCPIPPPEPQTPPAPIANQRVTGGR